MNMCLVLQIFPSFSTGNFLVVYCIGVISRVGGVMVGVLAIDPLSRVQIRSKRCIFKGDKIRSTHSFED
jgi:uncharacterized membrane protein